MEPRQHAKYDLGRSKSCRLCGGEDSITHRCIECPAKSLLRERQQQAVQSWHIWPMSKKLHLVPSENPVWREFKMEMMKKQDCVQRRYPWNSEGYCHLFTDGSCMGGRIPSYAISAWAVVDVAADQWVSRGALGGLCHCADRAELRAIIAATEYSLTHDRPTTIWTDCAHVAEGLARLLNDITDLPTGTHEEDWIELQGLLPEKCGGLTVQHIPGHVPVCFYDQGVRDWAARWNDRADREACAAQSLHGLQVLGLHQRLC